MEQLELPDMPPMEALDWRAQARMAFQTTVADKRRMQDRLRSERRMAARFLKKKLAELNVPVDVGEEDLEARVDNLVFRVMADRQLGVARSYGSHGDGGLIGPIETLADLGRALGMLE